MCLDAGDERIEPRNQKIMKAGKTLVHCRTQQLVINIVDSNIILT